MGSIQLFMDLTTGCYHCSLETHKPGRLWAVTVKSSRCNPWKEGLCSHRCDRRFRCFHCYSFPLSLLLDDLPWGPEKPNGINRPLLEAQMSGVQGLSSGSRGWLSGTPTPDPSTSQAATGGLFLEMSIN